MDGIRGTGFEVEEACSRREYVAVGTAASTRDAGRQLLLGDQKRSGGGITVQLGR